MSARPERPDELRALLVLDQLPGVGPARLRVLVDRFGSAVAALRAPRGAFAALAGREAAAGRGGEARRVVERAWAEVERLGLDVLDWSSARYPAALRHLADPPPVLFMRGRRELLERDAVTVVGARRATGRSRDLARRIGARLAESGLTVVSGMALGVDGSAHRGALSVGGDTVAVLGTGADVAYPRSHARLFARILERGLVVSEFLPGTPALPHHFPRRNRILAALARATIVVEAGARSGALITVDHALDLGREVWVVPGPIERGACAGSNRLLLEGARPLLSVEQCVSELAPADAPGDRAARGAATLPGGGGEGTATEEPVAQPPSTPRARVLSELDEPRTEDDVATRLGIPVRDVLLILTELEIDGVVRRLADMRFGRAA